MRVALAAPYGSDDGEYPPWVRNFLDRIGDRDPGSSAKSALCISAGLMSDTPQHMAVDASAHSTSECLFLLSLNEERQKFFAGVGIVVPDLQSPKVITVFREWDRQVGTMAAIRTIQVARGRVKQQQ